MAEDIKMKLSGIDEINSATVDVTFDPPWKPDMMNDDARTKLGFPVNQNPVDSKDKKTDKNWE